MLDTPQQSHSTQKDKSENQHEDIEVLVPENLNQNSADLYQESHFKVYIKLLETKYIRLNV